MSATLSNFSPSPAQESQSESIAAPVAAVQGQGALGSQRLSRFRFSSLIVFLMISPMAMATTTSIQSSPFMVNASISSISSSLLMGVIVLGALVVLALNLLALSIWWCFVLPHLEKRK